LLEPSSSVTVTPGDRGVAIADGGRPVRATIRDLVGGLLAARSIAPVFDDDDTLAQVGLTSMDMVTLLLGVENAFDLEVPQHEITPEVFRSVATIEAMVERLPPIPATA
jgi:acyl carrier protein